MYGLRYVRQTMSCARNYKPSKNSRRVLYSLYALCQVLFAKGSNLWNSKRDCGKRLFNSRQPWRKAARVFSVENKHSATPRFELTDYLIRNVFYPMGNRIYILTSPPSRPLYGKTGFTGMCFRYHCINI